MFALGCLLPLFAVTARRRHDVGLSGGWYGLAIAVASFGAFGNPRGPAAGAAVPLMLPGSVAVLLVTCLRGDRGADRYGPGTAVAVAVSDAAEAPARDDA